MDKSPKSAKRTVNYDRTAFLAERARYIRALRLVGS